MTARRPAQGRVLVALLLLACILAGGTIAVQRAWPGLLVLGMTGGEDATGPAQPPANNGVTPTGQRNMAPPESRFAVIALRPLFTAGRRPVDQPDSPTGVTASGVPTGLLVTGIVLAGEDSVAIIEPERPGRQAKPAVTARVGDDVAGWTVETIEADRVILMRDGARHEMPLVDDDDPRRAGSIRRAPAPALNMQRPAPPVTNAQQPRQQVQPRQQAQPRQQGQPAPRMQPIPPAGTVPPTK